MSEREKKHRKKHTKDVSEESSDTSVTPSSTPAPAAEDQRSDEDQITAILRDTSAAHIHGVEQLATVEQPTEKEAESLAQTPVDSAEQLNQLPKEVYTAYSELQAISRDLNVQLPVPEIVFVGPAGHGKTSIIEALLGRVCLLSATKRPLHVHIINNKDYETPKCTLKRDSALPEFDHDMEVSLESLSTELEKRSQAVESPIVLHWECNNCVNMLLIDLPGIYFDPAVAAKQESLILKNIQPASRMIVVVRPSSDIIIPAKSDYVINLIKRCDPDLSRTVLVYTRLYAQLQLPAFLATKEVNAFLSGSISNVTTFFVTLLSGSLRKTLNDPAEFAKRLLQSRQRDLIALEQRKFDKRFKKDIGLPPFLNYVLVQARRSTELALPMILKRLRDKNRENGQVMQKLKLKKQEQSIEHLRTSASEYVVQFSQIIQNLLEGTSEGYPSIYGQTLDQEKEQCGVSAQWTDASGLPVAVPAAEWRVRYWEHKVYGGPQFLRLLSEFKSVTEHIELPNITEDEIATAAGITRQTNMSNLIWAACDLVNQKTHDSLMPLIEQLSRRAGYIFKRMPEIALAVLESRSNRKENAPFFAHHVKDLYTSAVDQLLKQCKDKCMDEFYTTGTIYWDLAKSQNAVLTVADVIPLTKQIFATCKERITSNVVLKFHNFLLVPVLSQMLVDIHMKVSSLPADTLSVLFEVLSAIRCIKAEKKKLQAEIAQWVAKEASFVEIAAHFSHPSS